MDFLGGLVVKSPSAKAGDAGDTGSIPLWERSPSGEGRGNPLQCSCLKNPTDRAVWWATIHGVAELDMTEWLNTYICNWYNVPCPKPCLLLSGNNEDTVHCQGKKNYTLTQLKKKWFCHASTVQTLLWWPEPTFQGGWVVRWQKKQTILQTKHLLIHESWQAI